MSETTTTTHKVSTTTSITSTTKTTSSFEKMVSNQIINVEEDYEKQITKMKEEFNSQINSTKKENMELSNERGDLKTNNRKLLEELSSLKSKIRAIEIELQQLKQKQMRLTNDDMERKKQHLNLEEKIISTKNKIFENEMQDSTLEEKIAFQQDKIFELQMELDEFKFQDGKNENTISSYEMQLKLLNDEILNLKNSFSETEDSLREIEQHKNDTLNEKENSLLKITYIEKEKEELDSQLQFKLNQIENLYKKMSEVNLTYEDFIKKSDIAKSNIKVYEKRYNDALILKTEIESKFTISQNDVESKKVKIQNLESLSKSKDERIKELNSQISQLENNIKEYNTIIEKGNEQNRLLKIDIEEKIKMIEDSKNENTVDDDKINGLRSFVDKLKTELENWMEEYKRDEKEIGEIEGKIQKGIQKIFDAKILLVDLINQFNFHFTVSENLNIEDEESIKKIEDTEITTERISKYHDIIRYKNTCISNLKNHCDKLNEMIKDYKYNNNEFIAKLEDLKIEKKRVIEKRHVENSTYKKRKETMLSYSKTETEDIYLTKVAEIKIEKFKETYVTGAESFEESLNELENFVDGISINN